MTVETSVPNQKTNCSKTFIVAGSCNEGLFLNHRGIKLEKAAALLHKTKEENYV